MKKPVHSILLGSIGGDSHSVGLLVLKAAIEARGWDVEFMGTHNSIENFFQYAHCVNVVMISCMDGHAWHYLRDFPRTQQKYNSAGEAPLWYLGGNLTIGDGVGYEQKYYEMGFAQVFPKFVDVELVLELLEKDLSQVEPRNILLKNTLSRSTATVLHLSHEDIPEGKLDIDLFHATRKEVLGHWKTGSGARSLEENAEFMKNCPSFFDAHVAASGPNGVMLVQPRAGVTLLDEQIKLFKAIGATGVKTLSYQVDSLTRNNNYILAEEAIKDANATKHSSLNGFPAVNHGVKGLRKVVSEVKKPLQMRHSTRDPRLLAEISMAGGVSAYEGGSICYNLPYYKDYPLEESVKYWQYVDRLCGIYFEDYGIIVDREYFGVLTGTLIPPSIAIVSCLLEAILSVQQGVKSVTLGYAEQGNRNQDIAAIRAMGDIATETLRNMGYSDVKVFTVFNQYMAAFPTIPSMAEDLIYNSAITAAMSGASRIMVKTPVESYKIPTLLDNLEGINLVQDAVRNAHKEQVDEKGVGSEYEIICNEVEAIFESIVQCGKGNIAHGIIQGFKQGYMDIPFSPSIYNAGMAITARDCEGAVRFISTGNLQFSKDLKSFHSDKISERRKTEGILLEKESYKLVEKDVLQVARGQYEKWPLQ